MSFVDFEMFKKSAETIIWGKNSLKLSQLDPHVSYEVNYVVLAMRTGSNCSPSNSTAISGGVSQSQVFVKL